VFGASRFVGIVARPIVPTKHLFPDLAPRFTHVPSTSDDEDEIVVTNEREDLVEPRRLRAHAGSDYLSDDDSEDAYMYGFFDFLIF
jgi:hypothetical protein